MDKVAFMEREKHIPWHGLLVDLRQWIEHEDPKIFSDRNVVRLYQTVADAIGDVPLYAVADALDAMHLVPQQHGDHWVLVFDHETWRKWTSDV